MKWFEERLHLALGYAQRFEVSRVVCEKKTEFQELVIFETPTFGRVLALDGIIQTTEKDDYVYHEMIAHVPLFAHGRVAQVLIIGGGDGGVLREVLRHPTVARATLVDIDRMVIDLCREHMPTLSAGAFADARAELIVADGVKFIAETERKFDVIIVDSTDPMGPGEVLYSPRFYASCKRCLEKGGVIVTQSGVPFFQPRELTNTRQRLASSFADAGCYVASVPSFAGGVLAFGWGSDDRSLRRVAETTLAGRFQKAAIPTRYYTPATHVSAFNLPPYVASLLA